MRENISHSKPSTEPLITRQRVNQLSWTNQTSRVVCVISSIRFLLGTHFIFYYIAYSSIIHLWFWSSLSLLDPLPLRQMLYLVCACAFLSVPLPLYSLFIIPHPLYHWFNLTLCDWPSVPTEPGSEYTFQPSPKILHTSFLERNRTASSGARAVLQLDCLFLTKLRCSWDTLMHSHP